MPRNPLPTLGKHFGVKISDVTPHLPANTPLSAAHALFRHEELPTDLHGKLLNLTLLHWGSATGDHRTYLWDCYFPTTRPHVYHMLHYEHLILFDTLSSETGYSDNVLDSIMHQPKLHRRQLRRIGRYALEYAQAISSKKRKHFDYDPRHMNIRRALRDSSRLYQKGELTKD